MFGFLTLLGTVYHYFVVEIEGDESPTSKQDEDNKTNSDKVESVASPGQLGVQANGAEPTLRSYKRKF